MASSRPEGPSIRRSTSGFKPLPSHGRLTIQTHIFLTGATGYIGGSVLTRLLSHTHSDAFQIVVLVRSDSKAQQFRKMGIKAVVASRQLLAGAADIVVACADADDLGAAEAILAGMKDYHERTGQVASLIHTSGTGVLADNAQGLHSTDVIYSDTDIAQLESLPITQPHRQVDLALVAADQQGYARTYIVLPGTIYGRASGSLADLGLQNPRSQQIPGLIKIGIDRGQGGVIGKGKNIWPNVHIDDVADLYVLLFDLLNQQEVGQSLGHGRTGFYFAEHGEYTLSTLAEAIARVLYDAGKGKSPTPTTLTDEEMQKYYPDGTTLGSNSRCRANRARSIGWRPQKTTNDMLESVKEEVEDPHATEEWED
ncbi:hypothetical protein AX16_002408 [Volvariella volvacea WC 439]|nr:hypothetical protein AX16_002408 [Volvariella volvacea WC 439]